MDGEDDKNQTHGDHDDGGHQCWLPPRVAAGLLHVGGLVFQDGAHWQEFYPAQEHDFSKEKEDSQDGGEAPGQLDVGVHALVGGLADGVQVVDVAHSLHVGQDAGADEEGEEVHGHQHRRAGAEGDQQHLGVLVLHLQLHLHHGDHCKSREQSRGSAGGLQFSSAQVQFSPGKGLNRVVVGRDQFQVAAPDPVPIIHALCARLRAASRSGRIHWNV